jgi:glycosyltransferase involved in cell wall biosynthesis
VAAPVRVLELRSVRGTGGGPEKTILLGAQRSDPSRVRVTVAYIRDRRDEVFGIDAWASRLAIDYVELRERHSLDPSTLKPLAALVRDRGIDVIHAHDYKANLLALLAARATGAVPVSTEHGWTGHSWKERRLYYPLDRQMARLFPLVMAVSDDIRQALIRAGVKPGRTRTLLNGIDHEAFVRRPERAEAVRRALGLDPGHLVVGAVGRLEPQKRFDLLLEAFAALRPDLPLARLVIVGDGSQAADLRATAAALGLADTCVFTGQRDDVADLHNGFDLFVQSSDYEGTPNAVLEAMALGTPLVATDAGGTRQLVEHERDGLILPCGDRAVLVAAMRLGLTDRGVAAGWARHARRRVEEQLSFAARLAALEEIYREVTARRLS